MSCLSQQMYERTYPKGPRTQIKGFEGPNAISIIVFGPLNLFLGVLGPLGLHKQSSLHRILRTGYWV